MYHVLWRELSVGFLCCYFPSDLTIAERCKHTIRIHRLVRILEARHSSQKDIQPLLKAWLQLPHICCAEIGQESGAAHPVDIMVHRGKQGIVQSKEHR